MQNATFKPAQRDIRPELYAAAESVVIPICPRLLAASRERGVKVIFTVIENPAQDGHDRSLDYKLSDS